MEPKKVFNYYQYRSGQWHELESGVIVERSISLTVNGEVWLTLMCTPVDLEALAVGFLYNESVIQSPAEIASVRLCPSGDNVDVWLHHNVERPQTWRRTSGCTGGVTAADPENTHPEIHNGLTLRIENIQNLIGQLLEAQELYQHVGGVHTSALSDGKRILFSADDIGRHNTLDKLAGFCLLEGINPEHSVILTTGRISSEMLLKASRLGAAVVVSRTSPSSLSVELAQRWGITLIGYARRDRLNVYTHPSRLLNITDLERSSRPESIASINHTDIG